MAAAAPPSREEERVSKQAAKQYEEMMAFMEEMIITSASSADNIDLSLEERDLLSAVDARRASLRIISSLEQKEITEPGHPRASMIRDYRARVAAELSSACERVLKLLDSRLIPSATAAESKVLYYKMKGDHHRYLAELKASGAGREAEAAYECAQEISREELAATHPIRLGLALNFSVFHHDIRNKINDAWSLANQAVEEADAELDKREEEEEEEKAVAELDTGMEKGLYRNTTVWILQLLRNNLTLWTSHVTEDREKKQFLHFHNEDDEIPKRKPKMGLGRRILEAPEAFKSEESTLANEFFKVKTFQLGGAAGDGIGRSSTNDAPK
ncbi:hypothetical protein Tsubulata_039834 [Turnera subulata]|uniref:14-3-3 domain-containing protein n=1 Tax=Turnera subulata TaxID=218843 RepID=A0A9Q0JLA2_9ROSI|nr:hypothetical protein Tsubulata_039834 [Turnera subulata]